MTTKTLIEFTPLDQLIELQFQTVIIPILKEIDKNKGINETFKSVSGIKDINELIKKTANHIVGFLNSSYKKNLLKYYTVDGLLFYIESSLLLSLNSESNGDR